MVPGLPAPSERFHTKGSGGSMEGGAALATKWKGREAWTSFLSMVEGVMLYPG